MIYWDRLETVLEEFKTLEHGDAETTGNTQLLNDLGLQL